MTANDHRSFRLSVLPVNGESFGLELSEVKTASGGGAQPVARTNWPATRRVLPEVTEALRSSRIARTALSAQRRKPFRLDEPAGVRLGLVLLASAPLRKRERVHAVVSGINAMSTEEAYYWYARAQGRSGRRALRSLRLLLADD